MDNNKHRQPVNGGNFDRWCISIDTLESGKAAVRVWSDNETIDNLLEQMEVKTRFHAPSQMDMGDITPAQAIELLQRYFGGAVGAQPKRQLTDKQRAARAANAAKARQKRAE